MYSIAGHCLACRAELGSVELTESPSKSSTAPRACPADEVHLDAAPGAGLAWIKGLNVNEGCLSLEVKGSNDFGRSFVGLAFRGRRPGHL